MSFDILGTNCDQCLSMVQGCFTATETVRLIRTESPAGRPPQSTFTQLLPNSVERDLGFVSFSVSLMGSGADTEIKAIRVGTH